MSSSLTKLEISEKGKPKNKFVVPINPASIQRNFAVNYNDGEAQGTGKSEKKYVSHKPEAVSFQITFDGTGVVNLPKGVPKTVDEQIKAFKKLCLDYNGEKHEPNEVTLSWGSTIQLNCRLTSLETNYTLFKPDGTPLRAEAKVSFEGSTDPEKEAQVLKKSSPDLSHVRTVLVGDTLPLMCHRIYGNSGLYLQVARVNGLVNFRSLKPGMEILFPPIKK